MGAWRFLWIKVIRVAVEQEKGKIANQIAVDADNNKYLSPVAAKHIETMQRSNEQLVKIIGLRQKTQTQSFEFTEDDKDNLFDMIQGGAKD